MFKHFLNHQWLKFRRSGSFGREIGITIFLIFVGFIVLVSAVSLAYAMPAILTLISADMVGAGEWLLQTTVEYAKTRVQFDRPLGFFQAVKHPLVNVMLDIDRAKSLVYNAACSIDCDEGGALLNARMAKSMASDMAVFASSRAVQFHGGIGFTWECYVHIFFKRQMHNQVLYGDGKYHRQKIADAVIGKAA